ncbi:MAG TPA: PVC-type heme-binding CxxCH protein [Methylomirabilota bacterium]|nr:PVC-type heme-binding CxxCH protein [Methylomirabilota bacterium]
MKTRLFVAAVALTCSLAAAEPENTEAVQAMKGFRPAPGFQTELIAAEPQLQNPVAFTINNSGQIYVVETHRHSAVGAAFRLYEGVLDIRSHMDWLNEDLALRTVEERIELLKKKLGQDVAKMTRASEIVRFLSDTNSDRRIDVSTVFADGFNELEGGIAAGVLTRGQDVWFTSIPNLWQLRDSNHDGVADQRKALHTGFGVHIAFLGHDLHGLKIGPDGRLYFSIGDRGLHVRTAKGGTLSLPAQGAVLRCELDGSNLEIFARGLRNPQELAFDAHGNLFTGDNNSDGGDRARWVYVMEGSDSGWRIGYQHLTAPPRRGPWNAERLWHPQWKGQAAYLTPPIANLGYGPSGLAFYPGTGLPAKYQNHFFLADFRGGASSGIHAFTVKERGAGFEIDQYEQFLWEVLPTDVEFGPEPGLYYTDWVQGWNKTGKGRIYRVFNEEASTEPRTVQTRTLLTTMFANNPTNRPPRAPSSRELAALLSHADQRVRLEAQFALAERGAEAVPHFAEAIKSGPGLGRLHGIWGAGQLARAGKSEQVLPLLVSALSHAESEVRSQAAKTLGDLKNAPTESLRAALSDASPRVQAFAALSLGKLGFAEEPRALASLTAAVARNNDEDPWLRHALVSGLAGAVRPARLAELSSHTNTAVRRAATLALRRAESVEVARFLRDKDPSIVLEAARAIHDAPITNALPRLADLIQRRELLNIFTELGNEQSKPDAGVVQSAISDVVAPTGWTTEAEQLFTRVINANFRLGSAERAQAVARFAADNATTNSLRLDALNALAVWDAPSQVDRVLGLWRPISTERAKVAASVGPILTRMLGSTNAVIVRGVIESLAQMKFPGAADALAELVNNQQALGENRAAALAALRTLSSPALNALLDQALTSSEPALQTEALQISAALNPERASASLSESLNSGNLRRKQRAFQLLGQLASPKADRLVTDWLDKLLARKTPPELELDILNAANKRATPELLEKVRLYEQARPKGFVAAYGETLHGGDAEAGRKIFFERAEFSCSRCHTKGNEGGQAGPNLTGLGSKKSREYILESIFFPNAQIAEGWENVVVYLHDGPSYAGVVKSEDATTLTIDSPEDGVVKLEKSKIRSRDRALSAMPEEFRQMLTRGEARDLVEFLATAP